jgi:hypothetical protein
MIQIKLSISYMHCEDTAQGLLYAMHRLHRNNYSKNNRNQNAYIFITNCSGLPNPQLGLRAGIQVILLTFITFSTFIHNFTAFYSFMLVLTNKLY